MTFTTKRPQLGPILRVAVTVPRYAVGVRGYCRQRQRVRADD